MNDPILNSNEESSPSGLDRREKTNKPEITRISMSAIDAAWKKVVDKQARYRFVIDMGDR